MRSSKAFFIFDFTVVFSNSLSAGYYTNSDIAILLFFRYIIAINRLLIYSDTQVRYSIYSGVYNGQ